MGLKITNAEDIKGLSDLVRSLYNQYELLFDKTPFYMVFENAHGINWGRLLPTVSVQVPIPVSPGKPQPSATGLARAVGMRLRSTCLITLLASSEVAP